MPNPIPARPVSDEEDLLELTIAGLPAGVWPATLSRVTRRTSVEEETGEVKLLLGWYWEVDLEDHSTTFRQTTSTSTGAKSTAGRIIAALAPEAATPGSAVRLADLYGRPAFLTVEIVEGSSRIVAVTPRKVGKS